MKLAIVVGHEKLARGALAVLPLNQYEYDYNSDVAQLLYMEAREAGINCQVFFRDGIGMTKVYDQVEQWAGSDPACAIELHFNAADKKARGTETLYDDSPKESKDLAELVQRQVCKVFERSGKQDRGAKLIDTVDRGGKGQKACDIPSCVIEPFFGDNSEDARIGGQRRWLYARALVEAVKEFEMQLSEVNA